ncbi:UPF0473 protein [Caldalkalibacillus thermarum TA2.A1]|uniref:UPF0473 protein CathTA2_0936 n=1 Tax=Caldalkalibacillus thermarum (strain TA2.A1) TaxID=986075 RepID=F5L573_CALTT|nr:DUF1292 domain-containing protein [Caldalkalibacillus thermarum]EGL83503.1 UPF0473 protein [Caldalkalibacillus thermarum TA2.A1]QZT33460.1 DUF1292 domain-containing protein [Caldalkalibacillus thermarum TA2.A1]GGK16386.1 UPF0473 protein [Caldalkalibacillus thermarum]
MIKGREEEERIIIPDEEGNEEVFNVLYKFDVEQTGKQYILLVPADQEKDPEAEEQEVYAFRYEETREIDGGRERINLYLIEDEEEWDIVESTFQTLLEEEQVEGDIH